MPKKLSLTQQWMLDQGDVMTEHYLRALELLALRCCDLADRVDAGSIGFIDAVDMAYSAACWSGLVESVGDDAVQRVLFAAFATTTRGPA